MYSPWYYFNSNLRRRCGIFSEIPSLRSSNCGSVWDFLTSVWGLVCISFANCSVWLCCSEQWTRTTSLSSSQRCLSLFSFRLYSFSWCHNAYEFTYVQHAIPSKSVLSLVPRLSTWRYPQPQLGREQQISSGRRYAAPVAIDRHLLPVPELSSKPSHAAAAVDRRDRRTDGRTPDRSIDPAPHAMRGRNKSRILDWRLHGSKFSCIACD